MIGPQRLLLNIPPSLAPSLLSSLLTRAKSKLHRHVGRQGRCSVYRGAEKAIGLEKR